MFAFIFIRDINLFLSPSSVSFLIPIALNSLSGKLFISVSLRLFSRLFFLVLCLKHSLLSSHFV